MVPALLFAVAGGALMAERERATFQRAAIERSRALMAAVDAELRGAMATMEALGNSESLDRGDFAGFREETLRVLASRSDWFNVTLALPSGQQLLNAAVPADRPLPAASDLPSIDRAIKTRRPVVSDLALSVATRYAFEVRVPILRSGEVRYVLSAVIDPASLTRLLAGQRIPEDWVAAVLDSRARFVARTRAPPQSAENVASDSLRNALGASSEGWFLGRTLEGVDSYMGYIRSEFSGWAVGIAIPARIVNAGAIQALWLFAAGAAAALTLSLLFAWALSRRITLPLDSLCNTVRRFGVAPPEAIPRGSSVTEVAELSDALYEAAIAVREREQSLEAADRAKDEFLGMLGHELRNPLAALESSAHLLKLAGQDAAVSSRAQGVIARQVRHMARLVDDLLDVTRVTSGKVKLVPVPIELAHFTGRLLSSWQDAGRFAQYETSSELAPAWIQGDETRLEQVISNLLDNAIKYTPAGGHIAVRVRCAGGEATLEVADTGQGMSADLIHRVFDLFVQGERSLDRPQGGLGIGLTLVRRLVELHGGSVQAASRGPGQGATFTVKLPAIEPPREEPVAIEPPREDHAAGEPPRADRRRILIVEDNEDALLTLSTALRLKGHEVFDAQSGGEALQMARSTPFDVALIDIGLPGMDGYQLAGRLRAMTKADGMLLVALTGYATSADVARARDSGFDEHLAKPVEIERLQRLIALNA